MGDASRQWRTSGAVVMFPLMVGLFTLAGLGMLIAGPDGFTIVWFLMLGWFWFWILRSPFRIDLSADGTLRFKTLARSFTMTTADVYRVGRWWGETSGFRIYTRGRTIWLPFGVDSAFTFFKALESANPSIEFSRV